MRLIFVVAVVLLVVVGSAIGAKPKRKQCKSLTVGPTKRLGRQPWPTLDPFLFCAYHNDAYPVRGHDGELGPMRLHLEGREIGSDFSYKQGWSMYHGERVPGFPRHPHRGFETITVPLRGTVDHCDSLGAAGRYSDGDVQWLTAGDGIQHSEMFPLLNTTHPNPLELFQIWLNLPKASKKAKPFFSMQWAEEIPVWRTPGANVTVIAGTVDGVTPLAPPPDSYASKPESDAAVWVIHLDTEVVLPKPSDPSVNRMLYVVRGPKNSVVELWPTDDPEVCDTPVMLPMMNAVVLDGAREVRVVLSRKPLPDEPAAMLLMLQGVPLKEPVVQRGPFVVNTQEELENTYREFQQTQFGGWPWPRDDQTHGDRPRFARSAAEQPDTFPPAPSTEGSPEDL